MAETERCECPFCEYRRSIDPVEVIKELATDPDYVKFLETRIGSLKDEAGCRTAIGLGIIETLPLAMDLQARLNTAQEFGDGRNPFELIDHKEFDVFLRLVISFLTLIQSAGFADYDGAPGLQERIRYLNNGSYGHGSTKLQ